MKEIDYEKNVAYQLLNFHASDFLYDSLNI